MHRDDLLSQVRIRARLRGPNHARRVVQAVLRALESFVPEPELRALTGQLPAGLGATPPPAGPGVTPAAAETGGAVSARCLLIRDIARRLNESEPNAVFYARITFEQLNAFCRGTTPARLARAVPADLRPLLSARAQEPAHRDLVRTMGSATPALSLRVPARQVIAKTVVAAPKETAAKVVQPHVG
jgi:uncharacterized protein (DUF2267 family)